MPRKLTTDQIYEVIVELYAEERSLREISEEFGVSRRTIHNINVGDLFRISNYTYPIRPIRERNESTSDR